MSTNNQEKAKFYLHGYLPLKGIEILLCNFGELSLTDSNVLVFLS